jgi:hypothetical protein
VVSFNRAKGAPPEITSGLNSSRDGVDMQSPDVHVRNNLALAALAEAERRVSEINKRIEGQRQLIEELACEGHDFASAKVVFDSLLISLSLAVQDRHRLRAVPDVALAG